MSNRADPGAFAAPGWSVSQQKWITGFAVRNTRRLTIPSQS